MFFQSLPPDVQIKFERVALRNSLSTEELIEKNKELTALTWEIIRIFELNFRFFLNRELSRRARDVKWWLDPRLIQKEHLSTSPNNEIEIQFLSLGFLSLLLSDRYHNKLWVPYFKDALTEWDLPRRVLYQELRLLVRIRNRIAHHEIIYNYPLVELAFFAEKLMLSINPEAAKAIAKINFAAKVQAIRSERVLSDSRE